MRYCCRYSGVDVPMTHRATAAGVRVHGDGVDELDCGQHVGRGQEKCDVIVAGVGIAESD